MIFDNRHLTSFGSCKVVSWKSSIYTDFERKELTYRGRVLAAVEVPTLRKIEATVLVRGSTVKDMDKRLSDISKWLRDAGVSKLFAERDTTHYYLARCTSVSVPEYSGLSARFVAMFSCADNRLYNVYNNQPIDTATSEMNNFTFGGRHCLNDMGCVFVLDSMDALPKAIASKYSITGNSGTLRYVSGSARFEEKTMSGSLYFVKPTTNDGLMSEAEISERMHEVSSWLGNAKRASLILDSDISRRYDAEVTDAAAISKKDWENGAIKVKFILQPYSTSVDENSVDGSLVLSANVKQDVNLAPVILNGIGYETPLRISIRNASSAAITDLYVLYYADDNTEKVFRLNGQNFAISNGETVVIDSLSGDVAKGAVSGLKWVKSGDFPCLSVGGYKKIAVKVGASATVRVNVSFHARWL